MSTFKDRLIAEKVELDKKKRKLDLFINSEAFEKIDAVQMSLLAVQSMAMSTYSQCLLERIAWIEKEVTN